VWEGDRPRFVAEAVSSVLAQTHRVLELIITIDGMLTDELEDVLAELAEGDARIRTVRSAVNQGPGAARNRAIREARGAYIAILDADDVAMPDRLERQLRFISQTNADVAGSFYELIDGNGRTIGSREVPTSSGAIRRAMALFNPIANSTVMARTEVLREDPFDESLRYGEDYRLWIQLSNAGFVFRNQPECLVRFRTGAGFMARRRGWRQLRSDFANKMRALHLWPVLLWPVAFAGACVTTAARLLPAPLLRVLYRLRGKLRFS
jgi:glycosyltransferase involved in cell wall biosynthesis